MYASAASCIVILPSRTCLATACSNLRVTFISMSGIIKSSQLTLGGSRSSPTVGKGESSDFGMLTPFERQL